jgi:hypothetical protein
MVIPVQTNEEFPTVYDRLQQLRETGELKQVLNEGVAELAGYEADAKYLTLYPTNGDAAVRVPINDRDYYLAKPAPIKNANGSRKQTSMARAKGGGVIFGYSDGTPWQPAFTAVPPQEVASASSQATAPVAGVAGAVAQTGSIKIVPRRTRRRGSRGRRRR